MDYICVWLGCKAEADHEEFSKIYMIMLPVCSKHKGCVGE